PHAMLAHLRSSSEELRTRTYDPNENVFFDMITGRVVIGEKGLSAHLEQGGRLEELRSLRFLLEEDFKIEGYSFHPSLYSEWTREDLFLYSRFIGEKVMDQFNSAKGLRSSIITQAN